MSSTATPSQAVLNFDHEVTQWMSRVILVCGSALNSDQLHALTGRGPTFSVKVQSAGSIRGVGPAVSTGKLSTRCCPGGIGSERVRRVGGPENRHWTMRVSPLAA